MIGCAGSASQALEIRTATVAFAENATDAISKGEAFKARSEKREPPAKPAKESARVAALEKVLEQLRQATKKSEESSQQETDAPSKAAYKMAIKAFWRTADGWSVRRPPGDRVAHSRVGPSKGGQ